MLRCLRKALVLSLAVASVCSTAAFANSWVQTGYDTSDAAVATSRYACVYQELDDYGVPTGNYKSGEQIYEINLKLPAFAQSITWGNKFVDRTHTCSISEIGDFAWANHDLVSDHQCGNLEYETLILDGKVQDRVRPTGAFAKIDYKWENSFWELAEPHKIYQKKFANLPGLGWYTDASYPQRYSGVNEVVKVSQPQVGVDIDMLPKGAFNATGLEDYFNKSVNKVYQRKLTGTTIPVTAIDTVTYPNNGLFENGLVAEAKWIPGGYEARSLAIYEILSLDGYVMDGKIMDMGGIKVQKPYIYRYTGGYAKPAITFTDFKVDISAFNSITRTAPVVATKVYNGVKTDIVVKTGEIATLDCRESFNSKTAEKTIEGNFVARVNNNGTIVKLTSKDVTVKDGVVFYTDGTNADISWGYVTLYTVPQTTNAYVW